ncbi:hypothetical protein CH92_10195 [Stutzerimonas stutzeri]|uniref:SMP-30/Gluconolactonase/LRE-like region domain-containing protein n=1 Tax=Stutzerimonas stutzeri TaxID=316 RepID=W8R3Z1_STUST|nr:hypothetical protein [Stutzerimonas stutzeri]AHL77640.1 hypothetical protein CH92_10195 [Stutzerimonas stutzeri]MCQ4327976.1 hypothetical protein [Stutzerimonas stutzeri]
MNRSSRYGGALCLAIVGAFGCLHAEPQGPLRMNVEAFAELPAGVRYPEGLAVDPENGEIYVGTFDAREPSSERNNQLLRYSADGRLISQKPFGTTPLTGLAYAEGHVYILNFGAAKLQRISAAFETDSPVEDLLSFPTLSPPTPAPRPVANPDGSQDQIQFGSSGAPAPNGLVFANNGDLYVSDSFQGAVYRIANALRCSPCSLEVLSRSPLLATAGALPFGANGLAFNADESQLYINNAGDGRLLRMTMPDGEVQILAESLYGADGLLFHQGLLWLLANQIDQLLGLDENGLVRARAGGFDGIAGSGAPLGLLFPASSVVHGDWMVISNLALPLTTAEGDEWEEQVTTWNLMRVRLPQRP